MATQTYPELSANGQSNRLQGTDNDDRIIVLGDVLAENLGSHYIDMRSGNDTLIVRGSLIGSSGFNTVIAGQGDNALQFGGLLSEHSGINEISSGYGSTTLESTTQINIGAGGINSLDNGATRIEVNGAAELKVFGDTKASAYGYTDIYLEGTGNKGVTFSGNVTSTDNGALILIAEGGLHNTFVIDGSLEADGAENSFTFRPGEGELLLSITGQMLSAQDGLNEITSAQAFNYLTFEGGMKADSGTNRLVLNGENSENFVIMNDVMESTDKGSNEILLSGDSHILSLTGITSSGSQSYDWRNPPLNKIEANSGDVDLTVTGTVLVGEGGNNSITFQGSANQHTVNLLGGVHAEGGGRNIFTMGLTPGQPGPQRLELTVEAGVDAAGNNTGNANVDSFAYNIFQLQAEEFQLSILGGLTSTNEARNMLHARGSHGSLNIQGDITSTGSIGEYTSNAITLSGDQGDINHSVHIKGGLYAQSQGSWNDPGYVSNTIDVYPSEQATSANTTIIIDNPGDYALYATGHAFNDISTRRPAVRSATDLLASDSFRDDSSTDTIIINGDIHGDQAGASNGWNYSNRIFTNAGDDHVVLNGKVTEGSLRMSLGSAWELPEGVSDYDVLSLKAGNAIQFNYNYQDWLTDMHGNDQSNTGWAWGTTLHTMYADVIRVDIGRPTAPNLNQLSWLDEMVQEHNSNFDDHHIALELYVDQAGSNIRLNDLFSQDRSDMFSGLDMSGDRANTLQINGDFSSNGMDGDFLRVLGDTNDSVRLSKDWTLSQTDYIDESGLSYSVYQNGTDELLIQSGLSVV